MLLKEILFLVIMMIGNSMGAVASAGIGVAEKLVGFIMLIPEINIDNVLPIISTDYKTTLNTVDCYFRGMSIETDLVVKGLMLPSTLRDEL